MWRRGYPQVAADAPGPTPTFDEALFLACALLSPVRKGPVGGSWDPAVASWAPPAEWQPTSAYGYGRAEDRVCLQRVARELPGQAPVFGQLVAGGQQRSWLTCAGFLRIAR